MSQYPNHNMPPCGRPPQHPLKFGELNYTAEQINQLLSLIPFKMNRDEVKNWVKFNTDNYIGHVPSKENLKPQKTFAWAFVGDLSAATPYFYYTSEFVPDGYKEGWNDMYLVFGTYNLVPDRSDSNLTSEELFKGCFRLPELIADRALKDEYGNRIVDTYITRNAVSNFIRSIFNDMFISNPPLIIEGYITPEMLSEAVLNLLKANGTSVTNLPDGEDLTTNHGVLKFANKDYNPGAYSGWGRHILRKNLVGGNNLLVPSMVKWINTIYVIQYDYDLDGKTLTIPAGCTLAFEGGSINGGTLKSEGITLVKGQPRITCNLDGTFQRIEDGTLITKVIFI